MNFNSKTSKKNTGIKLEPIPKFDRNIAVVDIYKSSVPFFNRHNNKNISTITTISDELWDKIDDLLPYEKPRYTIGRSIIPFRKTRWYSICSKNRLSVEKASQRIWFWFYMPSAISTVG